MIYVDDSGWGNVLGGVMIGVMKFVNDTPYYGYFDVIDVKFFRGEKWKNKEYQYEATEALLKVEGIIYPALESGLFL